MQEIEDVIDEPLAVARFKRRLQRRKLETPFSSSTTTSPSIRAVRAGRSATATATLGNLLVQLSPLRVSSRTSPWSSRAWMR
jgi:hypothetical protein